MKSTLRAFCSSPLRPASSPGFVYVVIVLCSPFLPLTAAQAQLVPGGAEARNLALAGVFMTYYCQFFAGKPNYALVKSMMGITPEEERDPYLDSIGQYGGKWLHAHYPGCIFPERERPRIKEAFGELFYEWAKANPQARSYFPLTYSQLQLP